MSRARNRHFLELAIGGLAVALLAASHPKGTVYGLRYLFKTGQLLAGTKTKDERRKRDEYFFNSPGGP